MIDFSNPRRKDRARIRRNLDRAYGMFPKLAERRNQLAKTMSGGEQQILVVEQNANRVLKIAGRGYLIETGRILIEGSSESLRSDDTVRKAYLGE